MRMFIRSLASFVIPLALTYALHAQEPAWPIGRSFQSKKSWRRRLRAHQHAMERTGLAERGGMSGARGSVGNAARKGPTPSGSGARGPWITSGPHSPRGRR